MKKTFPLENPKHKPERVVAMVKGDVRKYLKRERRKELPKDADFWDFDCRVGKAQDAAETAHVATLIEAVDTGSKEGWEQIYIEMSPFFLADRMAGSLLMYRGMDDHNVGTHPDHSRRLFHALNVLGKDASLYMYPFEDHGPATRETLLDLWARWTSWLDLHVKGEQRAITFEEDGAGER